MNEVDTSELKPCPFCGGESHYSEYWPHWDTKEHAVWCFAECGGRVTAPTKTKAISAWNTRPDDASNQALEAENARLREAVSRLRWQWHVGARVRIADHCPDSEIWNRENWYIVGIAMEAQRPGLNIWICEEFPMTGRFGGTDGYWVDRPFQNDDLIMIDAAREALADIPELTPDQTSAIKELAGGES